MTKWGSVCVPYNVRAVHVYAVQLESVQKIIKVKG
jgi:hypothetical protein